MDLHNAARLLRKSVENQLKNRKDPACGVALRAANFSFYRRAGN
jgi:hypothetical protein